jgi:hypothetical protein
LPLGPLHGQATLRAIERLNLAFLVHARHDRLVGWLEVETDDVGDFRLEMRII